jgi:hypothetical protein
MKFEKVVENISTVIELKRIASPYVIDYRGLSEEEIKKALIKTMPQYYYKTNAEKAVISIFRRGNRSLRIIAPVILKNIVLQKDDFMSPKRETEEEVLRWEQEVIDNSNEDIIKKSGERRKDLEFIHFVLDTAWANNDEISVDEFNLLDRIRERLKVTSSEYRVIEAKLGRFPTRENNLHSRADVEDVRRSLQSAGLLFSIRGSDGTDFDIIPDEIADVLKSILGIEIRNYGYDQLLKHKAVKSKVYLAETLEKVGLKVDRNSKLEDIHSIFIEQISPRVLLGGLSPRDGLPMEDLGKWCADLDINVSGSKSERIDRIINFYDLLKPRDEGVCDEREILYPYFEKLACRMITDLRAQRLIEKDIEIERKFEQVTNYIFDKILGHKPLSLVGVNHADGILSFRDKVILWDNKSKESPVNLKDHIKQFDGYIRSAEKQVAGFLVIAPDFTDDSGKLAMQYQVENQVPICLIRACELKELADQWLNKKGTSGVAFQLGYLIQPGRYNSALVPS